MSSRSEKILLDFLEEVSLELKALGQKRKVVRRHGIILDDRLMQNTIVISMDADTGFCDVYCKRGEVGVFYYGFYKTSVRPAFYNRFLRMYNIFQTWNYKKNYLDLYSLFNKLTLLSFVEHWEVSIYGNNDENLIYALKIGDNHLRFKCYDSGMVDLYIDKNNDVIFSRQYERRKKVQSMSFAVEDKQEQRLILSPGSLEYQIMIEVITRMLDEKRYFEKTEEDKFHIYAQEHMFNLMDFPTISSFQETSQKTDAKVHFL
jgi:hypothetical protein